MPTTHTLVIGAGQAGLATSRCLTEAGIDHVVLERGHTAERWRSHRWDSLRLLTPNWASRLPGWSYRGPHPDGYMTAVDLAAYLTAYAGSFDAPIEEGHDVRELVGADNGFTVRTSDTSWSAHNVVMATGWCDRPRVPRFAERLDRTVTQITPSTYANPDLLPDGRVLVVGASATGVQIADELARAGRDVVLAVGRHNRVPRRYRGMDIWWWLDQIGTFARTIDDVGDPSEARHEGALQLVGREDHRDVDLPALERLGVRLTGRLTGVDGDDLTFADDLRDTTAAADERLRRLLVRIDHHIDATGLDPRGPPRRHARPAPRGRTDHASPRPARWHRVGHLGHGLPPCLPVAAGPGPRPARRDRPAARRHARHRPLRGRAARSAPTRLELHRRRAPRRVVRGPPHRRPSRPPPHRAIR